LAAECEVVVLLADVHGFLDNLKAPIELVELRVEYYRLTISWLLRAVGVSTELKNLTFVQGSSYQKSPEYVMDVYKLSSCISEHEAKKAGAEIVKQSSSPPLSGLLFLFSNASTNSTWTSTRNSVVSSIAIHVQYSPNLFKQDLTNGSCLLLRRNGCRRSDTEKYATGALDFISSNIPS
jgi:hypothetical protein